MKKTLLVGALVLPFVALGTHPSPSAAPASRTGLPGTFEPPREAPAFSLTAQRRKLSLRDHLGKVVIVSSATPL
jgi:hypothetical protein